MERKKPAPRRWRSNAGRKGSVARAAGHDHGYVITTRHSCQCSKCHYQASLTAGTLFHSTSLPLTKWFWAIYLAASDKGGMSAVRLSKQIEVSWITASRMLRKIRIAMGFMPFRVRRDSIYRHTIETVAQFFTVISRTVSWCAAMRWLPWWRLARPSTMPHG